MNDHRRLYRHKQYEACEWSTLRVTDDFGVSTVDLARPPLRFWRENEQAPPAMLSNWSVRQLDALPMPSELLSALPENDNWQAMTRRSIARLSAWFLITEDPQRRLDRNKVASLAHQASLVRHVLSDPNLRSVLVADEVGLGKTIEAGLIVRELLAQTPTLRVLYLAPARLVTNVAREFKQLDLNFRNWVAGPSADARLTDPRVIASIHRAVAAANFDQFVETRWDVLVVDECHHLSDYSSEGTSPLRKYRLVDELRNRMGPDGRIILLSGTPHQGHADRFNNLLRLLKRTGEAKVAPGRVIYRTKEDVTDWDGRPLFPKRDVRPPVVVDLGREHRTWLERIHRYFEPDGPSSQSDPGTRAATWRCAQALQWATSSVEAGLGYLVRQAVRAGWDGSLPSMHEALTALLPYRGGPLDESPTSLLDRIRKEVGRQLQNDDISDLEELEEDDAPAWQPDAKQLSALLAQGVALLRADPDAKWRELDQRVLASVGSEKVVLFAQPIETVTSLCRYLERKTGKRPALIVGNQDDAARTREIESFWSEEGPQFLVSSRAGGEGLNLQVARRLVHVDVPWNPMEMEQRVGRVHRFKSRKTILVDTLVTKDSREEAVYSVAREKLAVIAQTVRDPSRSQEIFSRVMALVPPDELLQVMGRQPLSPLSERDRSDVERLVSAGFDRWSAFDGDYRSEQTKIRGLDAGQATWGDVSRMAAEHLGAVTSEGFTALQFLHQDNEVVDASVPASVLRIGGKNFAVGDYGGMPITGRSGAEAKLLGVNSDELSAQLKKLAFGDRRSGAAHVRIGDFASLRVAPSHSVFGLLFVARQTLRLSGPDPAELGVSLHAFLVTSERSEELDPATRTAAFRALLDATARQRPADDADSLAKRMLAVERELFTTLARPTEQEIATQIRHAIFPLIAVVAS